MSGLALDLEAVEAFVRVVEFESFTRAADALGITQAAVSLRVKRLEERVGRRLVDRTSRYVRLSVHGQSFYEHASNLVNAHQRAVTAIASGRERLRIGLSDLVAGPDLPQIIASLGAKVPQLLIEVRLGSSADLLHCFDRRELDAVIARVDLGRGDGVPVAEERLGWFASSRWTRGDGELLPLVTLAQPCGVRALAEQLLDEAGVPWFEAFVGGGVATVAAAVSAGIGVAALAPRMVPSSAVEVGDLLGLPPIPRLPILLHNRCRSREGSEAIDLLTRALRDGAQA